MSSILSIVYLAVLAGCTAAALLTAIIFLVKKKAGKPLALYAVFVIALLGLGFLVSINNPVPNPRYVEPEPVVVSPGSQNPPAPWAIDLEPAPVEIDPAEVEPADVSGEPAAEPAAIADTVEEAPAESPVRAAAITSRTSRSTAAPTPISAAVQEQEPAAVPMAAQTQEPVPDPAPVTLSTAEPSLGAESEYDSMPNPELGGGTESADVSNPELAPEPTLATMVNPSLPYDSLLSNQAQDLSENAAGPAGNNSGTSGGSPSAAYIHDFSNGRVLITKASDNNGDPVYHTEDCRAAKKISPADEGWYDSAEEAQSYGRRLCGYCAK